MKASRLELVLVGLAGLTLAATVIKAVGLAAPAPQRAAPERLALAGYQLIPLSSGAPARWGRGFSHGRLRQWRLQPIHGGPPFTLSLLPVRSRNVELGSGLQMAAMGQLAGAFALSDRRLIGADAPEAAAVPQQQLALGRGPRDRAGTTTRLQTCLTPGGQAGVTANTLGRQLDDERNAERRAEPLRIRLLQFSGLTPNTRWECLAVQLATAPGPGSAARLRGAWEAVSAGLQVH